ncbi:uncharacterized protein EDB93DRAFT_1307963 [Suillus bovinus]|uniref:uncharacterized protein n=1 Tax=Suillus bovinus TaxID=48563 RepID=UPI001B85DEFB|nr:uncharacterized protein EDB93DRAFT_1307963 [Suillus bovinus]KAG2156908.1 hypothetical protein EDB93DRAFT_1307963 [Suillus bovinus]
MSLRFLNTSFLFLLPVLGSRITKIGVLEVIESSIECIRAWDIGYEHTVFCAINGNNPIILVLRYGWLFGVIRSIRRTLARRWHRYRSWSLCRKWWGEKSSESVGFVLEAGITITYEAYMRNRNVNLGVALQLAKCRLQHLQQIHCKFLTCIATYLPHSCRFSLGLNANRSIKVDCAGAMPRLAVRP